MKILRTFAFAGVSLMALSTTAAFAQDVPAGASEGGEGDIVVQARRKDEALQDVPLTVNAVTAETLDKLNIRTFSDVANVVPGLSLESGLGTTSSSASLRGVQVDTNVSGNNGTVEFYMNDASVGLNTVLQSMYDVGQVEVLRGPQGTLRGRASPSGSITVTTRKPDMDEWGGYVLGTITNKDSINANGAVNVPLAPGIFALRVAGLVEDNEANRVRSINALGIEPSTKTRAVRVSARFTPDDHLELNINYSRLEKNGILFDQVESAHLFDSTRPVVDTAIHPEIAASDYLAVMNAPRINHVTNDVLNFQAQWSFAGQRLNYVGNHVKSLSTSREPTDKGDVWNSTYPGDSSLATTNLQNYASNPFSTASAWTHELRLSSEERIAGMFDYVIGGFWNKSEADVIFGRQSLIFFPGAPIPAGSLPPTNRGHFFSPNTTLLPNDTNERALFGNITAHIGEGTEISGGVRHIWYKNTSSTTIVTQGGTIAFPESTLKHSATIWTASAKHRFNENVMVYATAGSSWRIGVDTAAIILFGAGNTGITDPNLADITVPKPETSKSYEIGVRTNWLDNRLMLNVSAFHQDFKNYLYSIGSTYFAAFDGTPSGPGGVPTPADYSVGSVSGLGIGVPAKVDGIEAEFGFRVSDNFNFGGNLAYARGKITNATIPCSPAGGVPTTVAPWDTANGEQILFCSGNSQRASKLAPFSATLQAEYSREVADGKQAFLRGFMTYKGKSQNEAANPIDDVKAYALFNLYGGVRAADGSWELTGFIKNLTNEKIVLTRDASPFNVGYRVGSSSTSATADYRAVSMTAPREFGLTFKYAFGSR